MQTIGIGITTRNRVNVLDDSLRSFAKFYCPDAKYVIVDDNSDEPEKNQVLAENIGDYHYNKKRLGVAGSKNQCIKLLDSCDHVFLFDDDCVPTKRNWWKPWIEAGVHHMVYACEPNIKPKLRTDTLTFWEGGFGCGLYFSKKCLETIGGFDPEFGMWGFEHSELTFRIARTNLVSHPNICPTDAGLWSFDAQGSTDDVTWGNKSSVSEEEKQECIKENSPIMHKLVSEKKIFVDIWK